VKVSLLYFDLFGKKYSQEKCSNFHKTFYKTIMSSEKYYLSYSQKLKREGYDNSNQSIDLTL